MKAFLGMGLLGSNFVQAMQNKGEMVNVWNRTFAKAAVLEKSGVRACKDIGDAVREADRIHLTLKDDASVDEVLDQASAYFKKGVTIVDHTTTSVEGAIERTVKWKERGYVYQHAPVFMGPPNALEGTGFMLISGDQEIVKQLEPDLSAMTGQLMNFGEVTGRAAAIKLTGNAFLVAFTAGIGDTLALAGALQVPITDLNTLFASWNPGALLPARLKRITAGNFNHPSWELSMARKDTGLFIDAAEKGRATLNLIPVIARLMDQWIERGHGSDDWTIIATDLV